MCQLSIGLIKLRNSFNLFEILIWHVLFFLTFDHWVAVHETGLCQSNKASWQLKWEMVTAERAFRCHENCKTVSIFNLYFIAIRHVSFLRLTEEHQSSLGTLNQQTESFSPPAPHTIQRNPPLQKFTSRHYPPYQRRSPINTINQHSERGIHLLSSPQPITIGEITQGLTISQHHQSASSASTIDQHHQLTSSPGITNQLHHGNNHHSIPTNRAFPPKRHLDQYGIYQAISVDTLSWDVSLCYDGEGTSVMNNPRRRHFPKLDSMEETCLSVWDLCDLWQRKVHNITY